MYHIDGEPGPARTLRHDPARNTGWDKLYQIPGCSLHSPWETIMAFWELLLFRWTKRRHRSS